MMSSRSALLAAVLGLLAATAISGCSAEQPALPRTPGPRYLILHQRGGQLVRDVAGNAAHLESMRFDGTSVSIPASGDLMLAGTSCGYGDIYQSLLPMKGTFHRFRHNVVIVHTRGFPDVFDDWTVVIANWRNLARAARDIGLAGIFFDDEQYKEKVWRYPDNVRYPDKSQREYQDEMRLRGRQVMEAVSAEFPEALFLVFHGPYISEPKTPRHVLLGQAPPNEHNLVGSFFVGLVEGAGPRATVVDGGEVYQYRTAEDFERSYRWRKYELASDETNAGFIPAADRKQWPEKVSIGFGVYTHQWKADYPMNPSIMRTTLENALLRADRYVWFYVEDEWVKPGKVSQAWVDAVAGAVEAAKRAQ
jgi:hypothetical protein